MTENRKNMVMIEKLRFPVIAVVLLIALACNGGSGAASGDAVSVDSSAAVEPVLTKEQVDSVSRLYGMLSGDDIAEQKRAIIASDPNSGYDSEAYVRGLRVALTASAPSESYTLGLRAAVEVVAKINDLKQYGIEVNRELLLCSIESVLNADSIGEERLQEINRAYNDLLQSVYQSAHK